MNKQLLLVFVLFFISNASLLGSDTLHNEGSKEVQCFFTEKKIVDCLERAGIDSHFVEKSNIVNHLKGSKHPRGVAMAINLSYYDYFKDLSGDDGMSSEDLIGLKVQMEMLKPQIYQALLEDNQEALNYLRAQKICD